MLRPLLVLVVTGTVPKLVGKDLSLRSYSLQDSLILVMSRISCNLDVASINFRYVRFYAIFFTVCYSGTFQVLELQYLLVEQDQRCTVTDTPWAMLLQSLSPLLDSIRDSLPCLPRLLTLLLQQVVRTQPLLGSKSGYAGNARCSLGRYPQS